jgi:hypothetical protein
MAKLSVQGGSASNKNTLMLAAKHLRLFRWLLFPWPCAIATFISSSGIIKPWLGHADVYLLMRLVNFTLTIPLVIHRYQIQDYGKSVIGQLIGLSFVI